MKALNVVVLAIIAILISSVSACYYLQRAEVPIASDYYRYSDDTSNRTLVILLPGIGESVLQFQQYGVVEQIASCQSRANILGVEAHYSYYQQQLITERLHEDVILPARERGIESIWLVGISMGGFGSLLYREAYPDDLEGIIVMAPYLGEWPALNLFLSKQGEHGAKILEKNTTQSAQQQTFEQFCRNRLLISQLFILAMVLMTAFIDNSSGWRRY